MLTFCLWIGESAMLVEDLCQIELLAMRRRYAVGVTRKLPLESSACVIGTPDLIKVPSVRVKRATATFFRMGPKTGALRDWVSTHLCPYGVA